MVGVSSPVACERSWSRIANFLTCSTCAYFALARSISPSIGALVVALEDVRAFDEDLAVVGDLQLDAGKGASDGAEAVVLERGDRRGRGRLGHAVALEDGDAAGVEELQDLTRDRRCAAGRV